MKKLISMLFMAALTLTVITGCDDDDEAIFQKFTVAFNTQGGSEVAEQTVYAGEKIVQPVSPTKEKAYFSGWFKEAECTSAWDFATETVSKDLTLYAKWVDIIYTVTFESNGGSAVEAKQVPEGGTVEKPQPVPTKEGYLFQGWFSEMTLTTPFDFTTVITQDITLYAKWADVTSFTQADLQHLLTQATFIIRGQAYAYTEETIEALKVKIDEVRPIAYSQTATAEEIATAYQNLYNAYQALVELPARPTVSLKISPEPSADGIIPVYVKEGGNSPYLRVDGLDAQGRPSTRQDFSLEFNGDELAKWGSYEYNGHGYLQLIPKLDLKPGTTIAIKVICKEVPSLSTTVTLKAFSKEDMKKDFLALAQSFPQEITFENCEEASTQLSKLIEQYWGLTDEMRNDNEINAAYEAVPQHEIRNFTIYTFKFKGNTFIAQSDPRQNPTNYEYKAEGEFPCGTYISEWIEWGYDQNINYEQQKIILKPDQTFERYLRQAQSKEGQETAEWRQDQAGAYRLNGSQAAGGKLITN